MPQTTFYVRPTRAYAGLILHRVFCSPVSYLLQLMLVLWLLWLGHAGGDYTTWSLVTGLLLFGLHVESLYISQELEDDTEPVLDKNNLGCYLTFDVVRHLRHRGNPGTEDLFRAAVNARRSRFVIHMLGLEKSDVLERCRGRLPNASVYDLLQQAWRNAQQQGEERISGPVLLQTFLQSGGVFRDILNAADLSEADVGDIVHWEAFRQEVDEHHGAFSPANLVRSFGSMGRSWVQGYTNELDAISDEISGKVLWRSRQRGIMLHEQQLESAVHILTRSGHKNMLFIGREGTGKSTMMENISTLLRSKEMKQGASLTRILQLKTETLLSGTQHPDRVLLRALEKAESSGKFILIIENLSLFLSSADANVVSVLTKFLQSKSISVFAMATPDEYHRQIKNNAALAQSFEDVYVPDADLEETLSAAMVRYFSLLQQYRGRVHITYRAMKMLLRLTMQYVGTGGMPGTVLDVFDDAVLTARNEGKKFVLEEHIRKAVSIKAHMDVEEITDAEKTSLLQLEDALRVNIVGQDEAITSLVNSLKRARLDINTGDRPMGTFLFLGPTGVGKTHTAKVLAREYFGSTDSMIRLDMNEYGTEDSITGIIGDPHPDKSSTSYVTKQVQDNPFSLILLDEIEKAHPKVLNVFLQILDEGRLADSRGVVTDFRNTIIISTSNAGALFIRDFVREHGNEDKETFKQSLVDTILQERIFTPEFVNRFDDVILYYPMSIKEAIKVALIMLDDIVHEVAENKGVHIILDQDVVAEIVKNGYSVEFGAREMRRVIVDVIENFLADYLLHHTVERGDTIRIGEAEVRPYLP